MNICYVKSNYETNHKKYVSSTSYHVNVLKAHYNGSLWMSQWGLFMLKGVVSNIPP